MLHRTRLPRLTLAAALLAAAPAAAQTPPLELYSTHHLHPTGLSGTADDVVLAQLTNDGIHDAAVRHGSTIHFLYAVDRRNQWAPLPGTYTSIAGLPGAQPCSRAGLIATDANGLTRLVWNATTRTFDPTPFAGTSSWVGATELSVRAQPNGSCLVSALAAGGGSVLRATWVGATQTFTLLSSFTVPVGSTALAPVDLDQTGSLEFAVAGPTGLELRSATGGSLGAFAETNSGSQLLAVPSDDAPERVAWLRAAGGTSELLTVVRDAQTAETPIWFAGDVCRMVLADVSPTAGTELIVCGTGFQYAFALRRSTAQGRTFDDLLTGADALDLDSTSTVLPNHPEAIGEFGPGSSVFAGTGPAPLLAAADLDGDGDDDLFAVGHPSHSDRSVVYFGALVDQEETEEDPVRAWLPQYTYTRTSAQAGDEGLFAFELPDAESAPADATHVRVAVFLRPSGEEFYEAAAVDHADWQVGHVGAGLSVGGISALTNGEASLALEIAFLEKVGADAVRAWPAYHERLDLDDFDLVGQPYVLANGTAVGWADEGTGAGGSTQRPPILPPRVEPPSPPPTGGGITLP